MIPESSVFKCLLRCDVVWIYHGFTLLYMKTENAFIAEKLFEERGAFSLTSFFRGNQQFHNDNLVLVPAKSNNGKGVIVFKNDFAPEVLAKNKSVFVCPILIKGPKTLV